jgi:hypothetical protein
VPSSSSSVIFDLCHGRGEQRWSSPVSWYAGELLAHDDRVLAATYRAFADKPVELSAKVPLLHGSPAEHLAWVKAACAERSTCLAAESAPHAVARDGASITSVWLSTGHTRPRQFR